MVVKLEQKCDTTEKSKLESLGKTSLVSHGGDLI
jgi:hypothetical protein